MDVVPAQNGGKRFAPLGRHRRVKADREHLAPHGRRFFTNRLVVRPQLIQKLISHFLDLADDLFQHLFEHAYLVRSTQRLFASADYKHPLARGNGQSGRPRAMPKS